ncbi:glycosyltransferase family 4 protein [Fluviicola chungangensis]|uniref:Glycosyltransferase family 4 protein n=1 Tax=Fluviicola chungangensis TaxID=2597671 RepID=A0A556N029_9FLAO|nr:glycosyltransferase family 1 protein [Fluviicola chungangensis]TSJ45423.1 glycosyltransferase family 4 protein [Fluviicola chungangensis]
MRIGVNTRFLLSSKMEGFGWYTFEVVRRMVEAHPEHEFVFFFDRPFDEKFVFAKNVTPVVLFPPARHPILFVWWFEYSIKRALKKYHIDLFYSPDGYLSLKSPVPQVGVIHDLNFEHHPEDIPASPLKYLRKYFPKFAKKATHILTVSEYSKQDIIKSYGISPSKITVAWNGASKSFHPLNPEEIQKIRAQKTAERPYFIFVGAIHPRKNVGRLIEAFGKFAEVNPDIDLMIVGESLWANKASSIPEVSEELKKRILFSGHVSLNELNKLMGAAFALTYIPYFEGFGIPLVEAMRCGLPIIAGNLTCLPEVAGDAAMYVNPFDTEEVSKAMIYLASDEQKQADLSQKSLERASLFSWDYTAETTWNVIEDILKV